MASFDVESILNTHLKSLDEDIMGYLISVVDGMSIDERKSSQALTEAIGPFLVDCGSVDSEEEAENLCRTISVSFGGSGYKTAVVSDEQHVALLSAPIKMIDRSGLKQNTKPTYGGTVISTLDEDGQFGEGNHNSNLDATAIPTTQRQIRKNRKENERLQRILRAEEIARFNAEAEMATARMAAIKANRAAGRQAAMGVNIERFCIPHPSGTSDLLTDASLTLASCRKYGLIGKNGAGKSTLMRMLANYKLEGLIHMRILLVDQHVEGDDQSPLHWVLRADVERTALLEDEKRLLACQHGTMEIPKDLQGVNLEVALTEVYERMETIGVSTAEFRARKILAGLGFTEEMLTNPTESLSGGWAMRAALAAALFISPDLLLLDEPTNHLDLHALVWLEQWLTQKFGGILLVVSHDQVFLDTVCTDILELKSTLSGNSKSTLTHYSGDYATFVNTVAEQKIAQARLKVAYEKEKEKLREFISREGKKYDNPAHQAQRKMKMKQLQSMMEVEGVEEESELVMRFPRPYGVFEATENLISVRDASFAWSAGAEPLFENVDFTIGSKARITILGKNGCGKTSLLNLLVGDAQPSTGKVSRHLGCRIARLQQHHYKGEQLDPNLTPLEHMRRMPQEETSSVGLHDPETRQEETAQRAYLSNFGIVGTRAVLPVRYLSGGQRMRVALAVVLYRRPDMLILDEPTNHLDSDTVRALCEALSTFEGAILAVSHDEAFVNKVINSAPPGAEKASTTGSGLSQGELWVLSKRRLQRFDGSFKEYKKMITKKVLSGKDF